MEVQGNLDNRKEFRRLIQALGENPEAVAALKEQLAGFDSYAVLLVRQPSPTLWLNERFFKTIKLLRDKNG